MRSVNGKGILVGLAFGVGLTAVTANLLAQATNRPIRTDTSYFVTGEGDYSHLWVREGATLRCVGHGACKTRGHDAHKDHDHNHNQDKKP